MTHPRKVRFADMPNFGYGVQNHEQIRRPVVFDEVSDPLVVKTF
jgi:hypothetical protein